MADTPSLHRHDTTDPSTTRTGASTASTAEKTAPDAPRAGRRAWFGLAALMLPVLLVSIDNTVLSFAIPQLSQALSPSASQLLWIVDIYPLILAGLLVTMGTLGDRVGRRRLLLVGATGFGLVSVYAAFAGDATHLIAARALLGLFGATLMPSTLALLRNLFLDDNQRRLAIAIWASAFSAGSALGPIVGGWLLEHFWWGSIFLINVPVLVVLLVVAPFLLPESRNPGSARLDPLSVVLSVVSMLPFVFGIKKLASDGISPLGVASLLLGVALGVLFVRRQTRSSLPAPRGRAVQEPRVLRLGPRQLHGGLLDLRSDLLRVAVPPARPRAVADGGRSVPAPRCCRDRGHGARGRGPRPHRADLVAHPGGSAARDPRLPARHHADGLVLGRGDRRDLRAGRRWSGSRGDAHERRDPRLGPARACWRCVWHLRDGLRGSAPRSASRSSAASSPPSTAHGSSCPRVSTLLSPTRRGRPSGAL